MKDKIFRPLCKAFVSIAVLWLLSLSALAAGRTYVVAVGINSYKYPSICPTLGGYTTASAKLAANFFHKYRGGNVFMLLDRNATRSHMLRVMRSQFLKADADDIIMLVFSGHGYQGGITSYGFDGRTDKGVTYAEVQAVMKQSKARRKVIIAEACYSGGFSNGRSGGGNRSSNNQRNHSSYNGRELTEVMLYLSSRSNEVSYASVFLNTVIAGLSGHADANKDRRVTCRELFNYVNRSVIQKTDDKQHPQMWGRFSDNMVLSQF